METFKGNQHAITPPYPSQPFPHEQQSISQPNPPQLNLAKVPEAKSTQPSIPEQQSSSRQSQSQSHPLSQTQPTMIPRVSTSTIIVDLLAHPPDVSKPGNNAH